MKIYTICFNRPEFIELQLKSAKKFVEDFEELIVINNAIDNVKYFNDIKIFCDSLNIKCIPVPTNYLGSYTSPSRSAAMSMNYLFNNILPDNENCCIIHSDMFFINKINLTSLLDENDIIYYPQYRENFKIHYCYDGFCILNLKKNSTLKTMNWDNGFIIPNTELTDAGGATHFYLQNNKNITKQYVEEFSIYDYTDSYYDLIINGNINYRIDNLKNTIQHTGGSLYGNKSFPHEEDNDNYFSEVIKNSKFILNNFKHFNFPKPIHLGLLRSTNGSDYFIIHYKTGSNYLNFCNQDYNEKKFNALLNFIGV
jgi:hypothetical protein